MAAVVTENVFTRQFAHAPGPATFLKVPGLHGVQGEVPVYPRAHKQDASTGLPAMDTVFAGQPWHVSARVAAVLVEYVLTGQSVHSADSCASGLSGSVTATLYFPAEHAAQMRLLTVEAAVAAYPALQTHGCAPVRLEFGRQSAKMHLTSIGAMAAA